MDALLFISDGRQEVLQSDRKWTWQQIGNYTAASEAVANLKTVNSSQSYEMLTHNWEIKTRFWGEKLELWDINLQLWEKKSELWDKKLFCDGEKVKTKVKIEKKQTCEEVHCEFISSNSDFSPQNYEKKLEL